MAALSSCVRLIPPRLGEGVCFCSPELLFNVYPEDPPSVNLILMNPQPSLHSPGAPLNLAEPFMASPNQIKERKCTHIATGNPQYLQACVILGYLLG